MNAKTLFWILTITAAFAMNGRSHIYVANYGSGTIGEYNLDGSTVNASLISGLNEPTAIAVSGGSLCDDHLWPGGLWHDWRIHDGGCDGQRRFSLRLRQVVIPIWPRGVWRRYLCREQWLYI